MRTSPQRLTYPNENRYWLPEKGPIKVPAFFSKYGARANAVTGRETSNYLEISFILDLVKNYFSSFFDPQNNKLIAGAVKLLTSFSGYLDGKRDQRMYGEVYSSGLSEVAKGTITDEQILDLESDIGHRDDALENLRLKPLVGEKVIPKFWEWATQAANIKPVVSLIAGFLGNGFRSLIDTALETPSRILWRIRFFPGALHASFVTTNIELLGLKIKSIFNKDIKAELEKKVQELETLSKEYFKNKALNGNEKNTESKKSGFGLYLSMLADRMKEHWQGIVNPASVIETKLKDKFFKETTKEERKNDRNKAAEFGYVARDENGKFSKSDIGYQWRASMTDFSGPIGAALGLIGTVIFDPLKAVWNITGWNAGKNLINALSASRKSFSLFNYVFRFIRSEMISGSKYREPEYKNLIKPKNGAEPTKAAKELYYALKSRYKNSVVGMCVAMGAMVEPIFHLFRSRFEDNKFANLLFASLQKFNDNGLVRLFSKRREIIGRISDLYSKVEEKNPTNKQRIENVIHTITDKEIERSAKERIQEGHAGKPDLMNRVLTTVAEGYSKYVKRSLTSDVHPREFLEEATA